MWLFTSETLERGHVLKFAIQRDSSTITYAEVLRCFECDAEFRSFFNGLLRGSPFTAFRWETPPITAESVNRAFEFVLLNEPGLARAVDPEAFAEHFTNANESQGVVSFANLRGDAMLVVPCPSHEDAAYGHLAAFVRHAPEAQQHALWQLVGKSVRERLSKKPVWVSTAGAGVSWLHVRLDDRPKYYGYEPYRNEPR
ncbi:MAG: hypothetical protein C0467_06535 [Planctomycetaceae bacterium]|nr:hypothetical protein [Planctomycetaceae bacterium]